VVRRNVTAVEDRAAAQQLLTVLAHDLRNHLTPLQGRLDLIRRRALREGRGEYLADSEHAVKTVDRLRRLIDDLLDVSRLERGLFVINLRPIDVAALVRDTAEQFMGGDVAIELSLPDTIMACADPDRLQQALENLLANAVGHSADGGVVRVECFEITHQARTWIDVRVSDQGPGIPPALMPRLFECFSTGPGSVGLGLGLYLAQHIAAAHGGTLTVDSQLGRGARFFLDWPARPVG
jgi:two-component system OmpR family sensor kinase